MRSFLFSTILIAFTSHSSIAYDWNYSIVAILDPGDQPSAQLTVDASGNIYGAAGSGTGGRGKVFEITAGSHVATQIASFSGTIGQSPASAVVFDAAGNLYGTTSGGGTNGNGTVYEVAKGSNSVQILEVRP